MKLMDSIGYNAIDIGSLSESGELNQARYFMYGLMLRKSLRD